jgi:hypothetical protein
MVDRTHEVVSAQSLKSAVGESSFRKIMPPRRGIKVGGGRYLIAYSKYSASNQIYDLERERYVVGRPSYVDGVYGEDDRFFFSLFIDGKRVSKTFDEWVEYARGESQESIPVKATCRYKPRVTNYTCNMCGAVFDAKKNAKYCPDCRKEAARLRDKKRDRSSRK